MRASFKGVEAALRPSVCWGACLIQIKGQSTELCRGIRQIVLGRA